MNHLDRSPDDARTNPVVFRVWYPRFAADGDFDELRRELVRIGAERVFLFDNGYMDNYQLSRETLEEKTTVLTRRIAQLSDDGILAGINSGATIGHSGSPGFANECRGLPDIEWWMDDEGRPWRGIACPMGPGFLDYCDRYFAALASTGAREIFIDDDMRMTHGAADRGLGCACDLHLARFRRDTGCDLSRGELVAELTREIAEGPSRVQKAWLDLHKTVFMKMAVRIEQTIHRADPSIRIGFMSVQNLVRPFGHEYFNELVRIISAGHRPLLRTHDFHGAPQHLLPGTALYCRRFTPPDTEHLVEIENCGHNFHDFARSPRQTRYAVLTALAAGLGGASINILGDQPPFLDWERRFLRMFAEDKEFFRAVARITSEGVLMRGVPIRTPTLNPKNEALNCSLGSAAAWWNETGDAPEQLLAEMGIPYEFGEDLPAMLIGRLPRIMGRDLVAATLKRGACLDLTAVREIARLGLGGMLRLDAGEALPSFFGHRFDDPVLCGPFAGDIVPTRRGWTVHRLEFDQSDYREATSFTRTYRNERVAPGIIVSRFNRSRIAVFPYVIWNDSDFLTGHRGLCANYHFRHLLASLLEWVLDKPLPVRIDGPVHLRPYYFDRASDGAAIISLLNPMPDDQFDFDLVLGDGERLEGRPVFEVTPGGHLAECPGLRVRPAEGAYRLRLGRTHAVRACDAKVLAIV